MNLEGYHKVSLPKLSPINCPCGVTRRAFTELPEKTASVHYLAITEEAKVHYHKTFTEIYTILEGEGIMELNGELVAVKPLDSVLIEPGTRHRAIGNLVILNVAVPAFDPEDEHFD